MIMTLFIRRSLSKLSLTTLYVVLVSICYLTPAQSISLNYENLSSLEEPIAVQYNDITLSLNGLADGYQYHNEASNGDSTLRGNFQLGAETQLANSWTLGSAYFGEYTNTNSDNSYSDDDSYSDDSYSDNLAVYLGGVWGSLSIGNVTGLVREQTRRIRGTGNAELNFDDQLGQLEEYGLTYIGRFGPTQLLLTLDKDQHFEIGSTYQRPIGNKDYRFSLSYRDSVYTADNQVDDFESNAFGFITELTYGSTVVNLGIGLERLSNDSINLDRQYLSVGANRKVGRLTFSGELHFGETEGQNEESLAIGIRADIARGLSFNLGINHNQADLAQAGVSILNSDETRGIASLRYSF